MGSGFGFGFGSGFGFEQGFIARTPQTRSSPDEPISLDYRPPAALGPMPLNMRELGATPSASSRASRARTDASPASVSAHASASSKRLSGRGLGSGFGLGLGFRFGLGLGHGFASVEGDHCIAQSFAVLFTKLLHPVGCFLPCHAPHAVFGRDAALATAHSHRPRCSSAEMRKAPRRQHSARRV